MDQQEPVPIREVTEIEKSLHALDQQVEHRQFELLAFQEAHPHGASFRVDAAYRSGVRMRSNIIAAIRKDQAVLHERRKSILNELIAPAVANSQGDPLR